MSFARNTLRDLVEKRLWPVALLMVVAIAAITIIGGGGSRAGAGEETLPIAPGGAANASSAVQLLGPPSVRKRAGKVVDPFRRSPQAAPGTESSSTSTAAGATSDESSGGSPGGTTGGTSSDPGKSDGSSDKEGSTVDKAGPSAYDLTKVADVRFGKRGATLKRIRNLAPLSELPSGDSAIVMFAGALKDRSVARFIIVASAGETTGTGECKTRNDRCVSIDMQAGDQQLFRVDGSEYELQLVGVNSVKASASGRAYDTRLRFGSSAGADDRSIARLSPLGGGENPALLYLGAYRDGERALFLLGRNASARTQGDCMDGATCRVFGLRDGESGTVKVSSRRYVIKVESVRRRTLSAKAAARARARVASGGREALRNMLEHGPTSDAMSHFRYSTDSGTIVRSGD
ncbi:MAG: hypothetical protein M3401_13510 [Actinomycetota bacterium]|nr:hypothetical protein [Actinomycetota bacterium]